MVGAGLVAVLERKQNNAKVWLCTQQSIKCKITDEEKKVKVLRSGFFHKTLAPLPKNIPHPELQDDITQPFLQQLGTDSLAKRYGSRAATMRQFRQMLTSLQAWDE